MTRGAPRNPFSARFHEPGALLYRFFGEESTETLWRRFMENGRRGEIIGPHGTGKTTLLRTLETEARSKGEEIRAFTLHNGQRWPVELLDVLCRGTGRMTLFLDGAEQLSPVVWRALRVWSRVARWGLLVTTHRRLGLPTLHRTSVDWDTAGWVIEAVLARNPHLPRLVTSEAAQEAVTACNGNLREALFRLYDAYETQWARGAQRT